MPDEKKVHVADNRAKSRYEAVVDGLMGKAYYKRNGSVITFTHTEVPQELQGHGVANALAKTALDEARAAGLHVVPACEFFAAYIERHPEYASLVDKSAK